MPKRGSGKTGADRSCGRIMIVFRDVSVRGGSRYPESFIADCNWPLISLAYIEHRTRSAPGVRYRCAVAVDLRADQTDQDVLCMYVCVCVCMCVCASGTMYCSQ